MMDATISFLLETEKLKAVLRRTKPLGEDRYENSAEHSWQTTLAALVLLEDAPAHLDRLKILSMLLIHDIVEIDTGDTFVYHEAARREVEELEARAAERIFGLLPDPAGSRFLELWLEFESRATPEAQFAKAIDRVMPVLQNLHAGGQSWTEHGIRRAQVLAKNAEIANAHQQLWDVLESRLKEAPFFDD